MFAGADAFKQPMVGSGRGQASGDYEFDRFRERVASNPYIPGMSMEDTYRMYSQLKKWKPRSVYVMPRKPEKAIRKTTKGKGRNYRTAKRRRPYDCKRVWRRIGVLILVQSLKTAVTKKEKFNCKREGS